jgi:antitoxin MazE
MPTQIKVAKWGNSLGVRIPSDVAARVGLTEGSRVDVESAPNGRIVITRSRRRYTLAELLKGMTKSREHRLADDGPRGDELI